MKLNLKALGAGLLSAGPLLIQFGGAQTAWWLGVTFTSLGPILLALQSPASRSSRNRRCNAAKAKPKPRKK